ncbi:hypothetical protein BP6252_08158 [Coleophoma cylindrospora]|uniref:LIM zinc-binding domain-containing protein n=1 Tax=Coleophoma cylindrospora TaxID=1849047 RepID=A0A3D8RC50_9HELO|nr:hypothetical protein BP6252_08158 [Coleophoma cylindrospora]
MERLPRESSFMPTIKCSMCAKDIEISMMGEHVCGGPAPAGEPTPPPDASASFDRLRYNAKPPMESSMLKPGRQMLPRVDTGAANRPFFRPQEMTPVSASPSRTGSPFQANGRNSPFGKPLRSATAPIQPSMPSPEFSSGLDSPFPPFPATRAASRPRTPQPQQPSQRPGGYGGLAAQKPEDERMYAPVSPRTATSGGLLQRMNTIAPGPFDPRSRSVEPKHQRKKTGSNVKDDALEVNLKAGVHSQSGSISSVHSRGSDSSSNEQSRGVAAPRAPRKNGYGGFGAPQENNLERPLLTPDSRSQTFPRQSQSQEPLSRRPSEPLGSKGLGSRTRTPSNGDDGANGTSPPRGRRPSMGPITTRAPPPRGTSLIRTSRLDWKAGEAPPMPSNINLAEEFGIGNPYHAPSESTSSEKSGYSNTSKTSSRSSPPTTSPARSRRNPSNTSNIDLLMSEIQSSMTDLQPKEIVSTAPTLTLTTSTPAKAQAYKTPDSSYGVQEPKAKELSYGAQEPKPLASSYGVQEPKPLASSYGEQEPKPLASSYGVQEPKPLTPYGVQEPKPMTSSYGVQEPKPEKTSHRVQEAQSPLDPAVQSMRVPSSRSASTSRSPPPLTRAPTSLNPARRPGTSKGTCKHCKLPIKQGQKSVSSADGRLTGRYHKTCFCCTTCLEPFSTSEFYVINDAPYCERHYHKLNGSMCSTCDKGIEGQYLESEAKQKFHPGCLTCSDCRRALKHDYFEMNGQVYCERDAFRRAQQQPRSGGRGLGAGLNIPGGTNRMQRRTTRLMMM